MKSSGRIAALLCLCVITGSGWLVRSSDLVEDPRVIALPQAMRARGLQILNEPDAGRRVAELRALARGRGREVQTFLLELLQTDPVPAVRQRAMREILKNGADAATLAVIEERLAMEPDIGVLLRTMRELHSRRTRDLLSVLESRLGSDDALPSEDRAHLVDAQDYWMAVALGGMLPGFLREAPPPFLVLGDRPSTRVLAFGDYGHPEGGQLELADAMARFHEDQPFDLGITLGDNFYPAGMEGPEDPRWQSRWSAPYERLGIAFYASLGNHDWHLPDSPAAEILHGRDGGSFRMPAARYTFRAGSAQFFALDTTVLSTAQLDWLREELERSEAPWKVVYGHHPVRSNGRHGDSPIMIRDLLPVLAGRADVYLAGHDHDMQHLAPEQGVHFFIAGSGGAPIRPVSPGPNSLFAHGGFGFLVLEIADHALTARFVNPDLESLYAYTLER